MQKWSDYYERLFNFREIRYFDIKGAKTGLVSKALTAPDGMVRIPLNESARCEVADQRIPATRTRARASSTSRMFTDNIYESVEAMRAAGRGVPGYAGARTSK